MTDHTAADPAAFVRALEQRRYQAMMDGDVAALDRLFADDLTYCHADGGMDTKGGLLAKIGAGTVCYEGITHAQDRVVLRPGIVVAFGAIQGIALVQGRPLPLDNRNVTVWVEEAAGWACTGYQATPRLA